MSRYCIPLRLKFRSRNQRSFPRAAIHESVFIDAGSILGEYSTVFKNVKIIQSSVGSFSYIQEGSSIYRTDVGNFCSIAGNVIIGYPDHPMSLVSTSPVFYDTTQPLALFLTDNTNNYEHEVRSEIGSDVWLGQNTFIKAGICIGTGSVIGAGSVVTKNIPPYSIAVGNPCKVIRPRFSADTSMKLLRSCWWELDHTVLNSLSIHFSNPLVFLEELSKFSRE